MAWTLEGGDRNEISRRRRGVARTLEGTDRGDLTSTDRQVALHKKYLQTGWIGRVEVNRDTGLEPGETFCLCVSPGSSPA